MTFIKILQMIMDLHAGPELAKPPRCEKQFRRNYSIPNVKQKVESRERFSSNLIAVLREGSNSFTIVPQR